MTLRVDIYSFSGSDLLIRDRRDFKIAQGLFEDSILISKSDPMRQERKLEPSCT